MKKKIKHRKLIGLSCLILVAVIGIAKFMGPSLVVSDPTGSLAGCLRTTMHLLGAIPPKLEPFPRDQGELSWRALVAIHVLGRSDAAFSDSTEPSPPIAPTQFSIDSKSACVFVVRGEGTAASVGIPITDLPDHLVVTIAVNHTTLVPWEQPADVSLSELRKNRLLLIGDSGSSPLEYTQLAVGFADGSVWGLKPNTPLDKLATCCDIRTASVLTKEYLHAYLHPTHSFPAFEEN